MKDVATTSGLPPAPVLTIRGNVMSSEDQLRLEQKLKAVARPPPSAGPEAWKAYKRKRRAIKNRESAHRSRIRKRQKTDHLEAKMVELEETNAQYERQLAALRERVRQLEERQGELESSLFRQQVRADKAAAGSQASQASQASRLSVGRLMGARLSTAINAQLSAARPDGSGGGGLGDDSKGVPALHVPLQGKQEVAAVAVAAAAAAAAAVSSSVAMSTGGGACVSATLQRRCPHEPVLYATDDDADADADADAAATDDLLDDLADWEISIPELSDDDGGSDSSSSSSSVSSPLSEDDVSLLYDALLGYDDAGGFPL